MSSSNQVDHQKKKKKTNSKEINDPKAITDNLECLDHKDHLTGTRYQSHERIEKGFPCFSLGSMTNLKRRAMETKDKRKTKRKT